MEAGGCYFYRQPVTPDELRRAATAVVFSCCQAVRYGGTDASVFALLEELEPDVK